MYEVQSSSYNQKTNTLVIRLDQSLTEFSAELKGDDFRKKQTESIYQLVRKTLKKNFNDVPVRTVKVMVGSLLVSTLYFGPQTDVEGATDFNMGYLYFGTPNAQVAFVDRTDGVISHTSPSYFDIYSDGTLDTSNLDERFISEMHNRGIKVVPFLSNHWDRELGRVALANREQLAQQIADVIRDYNLDGVNVDIENVTHLDKDDFTDLVRLLREKIPDEKEVSVAVAANPNGWTTGWHGSYDLEGLAKYSDYLMLMAYDESWLGSEPGPVASLSFVERSIQYKLDQGVSNEKLVLGLPHYGRYWIEGQSYGGFGITNQRVEDLLRKYPNTITFDSVSQSPMAKVTILPGSPITYVNNQPLQPGTYTIWYENEQSIKAKVDLVDKYDLKGTGSWALGQENPELWSGFKNWLPSVLSPDYDYDVNQRIAFALENVYLRSNASRSSSVVHVTARDERFQIIGEVIESENSFWYPVQLSDDRTGYVHSGDIKVIHVDELHGDTRFETSVSISKRGWPETSDYVVLGRGDDPIDALTGSVLARKLNAPLLLTNTSFIPNQISQELDRLKPKQVIVLGGENAISTEVVEQLQSQGKQVQRISGRSRYETALEIANKIGPTNEIFLATGVDSPDPLSVAPYAAMKQIPILLTKSEEISDEVIEFINAQNINKVTIIGGEDAVSKRVEEQIQGVREIKRIYGEDRYETSIEIANTFREDFDLSNVFFASGVSYIDALSGAPYAAMRNAPIILLNRDHIPHTVSEWVDTHVKTDNTQINFLGGVEVITNDNRNYIFRKMK